MNLNSLPPLKMLLLCFVVIFQFSCSKDSDLLTDYVISDTSVSKGIANLVVDDTYQVSLSGSIILDVLANDTFENGAEVVISETSTPANGTVAINNDETLTYTPNAEILEQVSDAANTAVGEVIDTFTYTAEVVTGDGTASSEEASVVITAGDNTARQEGVNLSTYGAVGDGVTDDTASIQNALDNETNITSDPNKTYLISGTLVIDRNMAQIIDFNGSTITRKAHVHWMLNIDKRNYSNTLTTITNLNIDGNDKGGSVVDIKSRVNFENIDIYDVIYDNANGIRLMVYDVPGVYGQSIFDNVNIFKLRSNNSDGSSGNNPGMVHGFLVSAQDTPTQDTQIVYKNSSLYELWGEDAGGITLNSPGRDTSNSPLSFWFENVNISDAQRRTVKCFIGNTTWVNCVFTAAANDNPNLVAESEGGLGPAGLFVISSGSSATGATNNVVCGCTFQGHPDAPFASWYTEVLVVGQFGPAGADFRNCSFTGGHVGFAQNGFTAYTAGIGTIQNISFANCTFGATNKVKVVREPTDYFQMSTDNTYVGGKTTVMAPTTYSYKEPTIPFEACPSIDD